MLVLEHLMHPGNETQYSDSSDEENWDLYHHCCELHPTIPFLASEDEDNSSSAGHICLFLPKFHCELNPIEMVCIFFVINSKFLTLNHAVLGLYKIPVL